MRPVSIPFKKASLGTKGSLLLESTIARTVFAVVGGTVLAGTSTPLKTGDVVEGQSIAEEIARNQMESVFNESYQEPRGTPYATMVHPTGYSVSVTAVVMVRDTSTGSATADSRPVATFDVSMGGVSGSINDFVLE